jgi:hypothetical protein
MQQRSMLAIALTAIALSAAPAKAQSLTGTWSLSSETGRGTQTQTLTLTQDGMKLTGTITFGGGRRGGGGGGGAPPPVDISDGKVDGKSFSFTMTIDFNGNTFTQQYSGTVDGNAMTGEIAGGRGGSRPFTGTRGS